jgi:hypothetical protein
VIKFSGSERAPERCGARRNHIFHVRVILFVFCLRVLRGEEEVNAVSERRIAIRYPVELNGLYRILVRGRRMEQRPSRTADVSSKGVRFSVESPVSAGDSVELALDWPLKLNPTCPLRLVLKGSVARSSAGWAAMVIRHHEFRLAGSRRAQSMAGESLISCKACAPDAVFPPVQ